MPECVAIKNDGLQCRAMTGIQRDHGGIQCMRHWPILAETINIHGVENGLVIHQERETRLVVDGARARVRHNEWLRRVAENAAEAGRNARVVDRRGELQRFADDNQNVHTTEAVNRTKQVVKEVLKITVPQDYRWNVRTVSKTPGEIIMNCALGINACRIMMDKYTLDENIYEMGNGIYGKVLDGVWQYIKNSNDKEDLCKILAQELRENVGMCLQGNLSRLCNVLAGYMDGMSQESVAEILGREFAIISQIADNDERFSKANKILDDNNVTNPVIREEWISALFN